MGRSSHEQENYCTEVRGDTQSRDEPQAIGSRRTASTGTGRSSRTTRLRLVMPVWHQGQIVPRADQVNGSPSLGQQVARVVGAVVVIVSSFRVPVFWGVTASRGSVAKMVAERGGERENEVLSPRFRDRVSPCPRPQGRDTGTLHLCWSEAPGREPLWRPLGVDIDEHDYRPGHFIRGDALSALRDLHTWGRKPDLIHASPPCQRYSAATGIIAELATI